uniref:Aminotransferase-like plant mobile domain-containing protein n=1 Tax=Oryza nivara TaxID=4536 RepID=A0A0E0J2P5_ORYNI
MWFNLWANCKLSALCSIFGLEEAYSSKEISAWLSLLNASLCCLQYLEDKVINYGGPWWFMQLWINMYTRPSLALSAFPTTYTDDEDVSTRRCMSFGEAAIETIQYNFSASPPFSLLLFDEFASQEVTHLDGLYYRGYYVVLDILVLIS